MKLGILKLMLSVLLVSKGNMKKSKLVLKLKRKKTKLKQVIMKQTKSELTENIKKSRID